jgi:hypothetical protein
LDDWGWDGRDLTDDGVLRNRQVNRRREIETFGGGRIAVAPAGCSVVTGMWVPFFLVWRRH